MLVCGPKHTHTQLMQIKWWHLIQVDYRANTDNCISNAACNVHIIDYVIQKFMSQGAKKKINKPSTSSKAAVTSLSAWYLTKFRNAEASLTKKRAEITLPGIWIVLG